MSKLRASDGPLYGCRMGEINVLPRSAFQFSALSLSDFIFGERDQVENDKPFLLFDFFYPALSSAQSLPRNLPA